MGGLARCGLSENWGGVLLGGVRLCYFCGGSKDQREATVDIDLNSGSGRSR